MIALDPPTVETNLFWQGIGEKMPSMYGLVGAGDRIVADSVSHYHLIEAAE